MRPPGVTIHADDHVLMCHAEACMHATEKQGYFVADTRLVSDYKLTLSGEEPILVDSAAIEAFSARFEFLNRELTTSMGTVPAHAVHVRLDRVVGRGVHEDYDVFNHADRDIEIDLQVCLDSDFVDLLDVRNGNFITRGSRQMRWSAESGRLECGYHNADFQRGVRFEVHDADSVPEHGAGTVSFRIRLAPGGHWHTCLLWMPWLDGDCQHPVSPCHDLTGAGSEAFRGLRAWRNAVAMFDTGSTMDDAVVRRAVSDLSGLRLHRHNIEAAGGGDGDVGAAAAWVPAGGVPWYVSLFGRDALVCALQTMALSHRFSAAAVEALTRTQGDRYDDAHDLQPGKVQHEWRHGELAHFGCIPQTPYYGDHGATTLFVWAAGELWRWQGDRRFLERIRPNVERALTWIDRDGDLDGDGLQEYRTRAEEWGAYNQGWKDADDAIVHADGSIAPLPIAVVEQQAYVVAAKRAWAQVLEEAFADDAGARHLRRQADELAGAIEERFWWEEEGTYYLGLDGEKRPIESVTSNPGQLLWAQIASADRARRVVDRLMAPDMWSGWGVRTLSADHPAYDPFSYQRGSVWPHDNGILAAGCYSYGFADEASQIVRAIFDAARHFERSRLPEVFAGVQREPGAFPPRYVGACAPQAWSAGAVFHTLSAVLGLQPHAASGRLMLSPAVPDWLDGLAVRGLRVGSARVDLVVAGNEIRTENVHGELRVETARQPDW